MRCALPLGPLAGILLLGAMTFGGCSATAPARAPGCGKDTDCKGARICVEGSCVDRARGAPDALATVAPPPATALQQAAPPSPAPAPEPTDAPQPPPTAQPTTPPAAGGTVSSSETTASRCGCARGDASCAMKCAQRDNAAGPSTWPSEGHQPKRDCDCPKGDLTCSMRCNQK